MGAQTNNTFVFKDTTLTYLYILHLQEITLLFARLTMKCKAGFKSQYSVITSQNSNLSHTNSL